MGPTTLNSMTGIATETSKPSQGQGGGQGVIEPIPVPAVRRRVACASARASEALVIGTDSAFTLHLPPFTGRFVAQGPEQNPGKISRVHADGTFDVSM